MQILKTAFKMKKRRKKSDNFSNCKCNKLHNSPYEFAPLIIYQYQPFSATSSFQPMQIKVPLKPPVTFFIILLYPIKYLVQLFYHQTKEKSQT